MQAASLALQGGLVIHNGPRAIKARIIPNSPKRILSFSHPNSQVTLLHPLLVPQSGEFWLRNIWTGIKMQKTKKAVVFHSLLALATVRSAAGLSLS